MSPTTTHFVTIPICQKWSLFSYFLPWKHHIRGPNKIVIYFLIGDSLANHCLIFKLNKLNAPSDRHGPNNFTLVSAHFVQCFFAKAIVLARSRSASRFYKENSVNSTRRPQLNFFLKY